MLCGRARAVARRVAALLNGVHIGRSVAVGRRGRCRAIDREARARPATASSDRVALSRGGARVSARIVAVVVTVAATRGARGRSTGAAAYGRTARARCSRGALRQPGLPAARRDRALRARRAGARRGTRNDARCIVVANVPVVGCLPVNVARAVEEVHALSGTVVDGTA